MIHIERNPSSSQLKVFGLLWLIFFSFWAAASWWNSGPDRKAILFLILAFSRSALMAPFVGGMSYVIKRSAKYAMERHQFGRPIAEFQAIKHKLANMKIFLEASRSLCYRIAWCKDQGRALNHLEAAVAKLFIGDWSLGPANEAVTLHGGYGYCHEYEVERFFRDSRLAPIGGGSSEVTKRIISRLI